MNDGEISDSVYCLGSACARDLPDIEYMQKLPKKGVPYNELPEEKRLRRPEPHECEVYSFPQMWGDTSLGFGGMAGQAITTAQSTVVIEGHMAAVYFGRRHAYTVPVTQDFMQDVGAHCLVSVAKAAKYRSQTHG